MIYAIEDLIADAKAVLLSTNDANDHFALSGSIDRAKFALEAMVANEDAFTAMSRFIAHKRLVAEFESFSRHIAEEAK